MKQDRNTRPFTARSVVASLLLGTQPPRLPGAALVRAAGALGCAEGTTRVALSRMVAAGELVGAEGVYELAGPLAARQERQEAGRHPALREWDGTWVLAVVGGSGARTAGERALMRRQLIDLRLAEWREGVWLRPDNLPGRRPALEDGTWVSGARLDVPEGLWDLDGWAAGSRDLLDELAPGISNLGAAFALAAAVVRHLRDDPLLPPSLLPPSWPGAALRAAYDGYEASVRAALRPVLTGS
ncbi:MAG: PaaX family transcriptional regulator C-terminal domain-containing protein [Acidimicrobiales bacterium]